MVFVNRWRKASRLPPGYTEVSYIESHGSEFIDTRIIDGLDTEVELDAQFTQNGIDHILMASNLCMVFYNYLSTFYIQCFGASISLSADLKRHKIFYSGVYNNAYVIYDGERIEFDHAPGVGGGYSYYLFARNNAGSLGWPAFGRIYSCKIWKAGELVRDYIPCINSSERAGLFDTVSQTFYDNQSSGDFTYGV